MKIKFQAFLKKIVGKPQSTQGMQGEQLGELWGA
jgi:hypothetical protein